MPVVWLLAALVLLGILTVLGGVAGLTAFAVIAVLIGVVLVAYYTWRGSYRPE